MPRALPPAIRKAIWNRLICDFAPTRKFRICTFLWQLLPRSGSTPKPRVAAQPRTLGAKYPHNIYAEGVIHVFVHVIPRIV